jgi:TonB family protein
VAWAAAGALVAFVWQGAIIGFVTAIGLILLRRHTARLRYQIACTGLAALCAAPVATGFLRFDPDRAIVQRTGPSAARDRVDAAAPANEAAPIGASNQFSSPTTLAKAAEWLNTRLPALLLVWAAGVFVLALRLGRGWINVSQLRREAKPLVGHPVAASAARIARRLGVRRSVQLLSSARVMVPAVIGWIRPAILFPAAVVAGMPAAHLDAILAHELAHIRRSDFLVNVIQSAAEVLLFYHPAVWWVSRQIRVERELCADDMAVAVSGDRVAYAAALTSLESLRAEPLAIAMVSGDDLLTRVRRLLEPDVAANLSLRPRISGGFAMTVAVMLLLFALTGTEAGTSAASPIASSVAAIGAEPHAVAPLPATTKTTTPSLPSPAPKKTAKPRPAPQAAREQVTGVVRDKSGGVLPGVDVTINVPPGSPLQNPGANRAITNARGSFSFPEVQPGDYELTVSLRGFRTSRTRLNVAAGQSPSVVITLEIGSLSEQVTIRTAAAPEAPRPNVRPQAATDYFDLAKSYYQQGRLLEAEEMTTRALALMRSETPTAPAGAAAVPASGVPIRVGGDIVEPRKIRDVKPTYPPDAAAAGTEGTVIIEASIGRDGTVQNARVIRSIPGLDDSALAAVRQWLYTPTKLNGMPVEVVITVTVSFLR